MVDNVHIFSPKKKKKNIQLCKEKPHVSKVCLFDSNIAQSTPKKQQQLTDINIWFHLEWNLNPVK